MKRRAPKAKYLKNSRVQIEMDFEDYMEIRWLLDQARERHRERANNFRHLYEYHDKYKLDPKTTWSCRREEQRHEAYAKVLDDGITEAVKEAMK